MDPNITSYLFHNCSKHLTVADAYVLRHLLYSTRFIFILKIFAFLFYIEEYIRLLKNKTLLKHETLTIIEVIIATRIIKEHPEVINNCPKCNRLTRTPMAKQCRYCFHTWY